MKLILEGGDNNSIECVAGALLDLRWLLYVSDHT